MRLATFSVCLMVTAAPVLAQTPTPPISGDPISRSLARLGMNLPRNVAETSSVRAPLEELDRETCDRQAAANLGMALRRSGYRREGAKGLVAFSESCKGDAPSLRVAVNIYLDISDYKEMARVAGELIKLEPLQDNGYFLRAVAHERGGDHKRAIDDYSTALELFANKTTISNASYMGLARSHEKLGNPCDAALAIEAWVAANPTRNDTSQARTMIADYTSKGKCGSGEKMDDTFPIQRRGNVVLMDATINGVKGRFVFDTGATYVSVKRSFATKAKIEIDEDSVVKLSTANGITEGKRGRAKTVQLKTVRSSDVPLVVQNDQKGTYGDDVDGLLGMSFLSRFNVTINRDTVRITSRQGR
jgi:clan AA aspartic protease (TIGR02281 family)